MRVEKGWGHEEIFVSTEAYCGKLLCFEPGKKFSMHFHRNKDETWCVLEGTFRLDTIDTNTATPSTRYLYKGDVWHNPPLLPHQLHCLEGPGIIVEVSTRDTPEDNYRILPGDSQQC
jgi:mannose-6-phosphate isomerase-like protein (cupin superfamily)